MVERESSSGASDSEQSDDSGARTRQWANMQQEEEMDQVFIDEDLDEDELLPDVFDADLIQLVKTEHCQLCDTKFSMFGSAMHNCRKCGKAVCDPCSRSQRRLSKMEKKKYRVCDECDCLLSNYNFTRMYEREIEDKKQQLEEVTTNIERCSEEINEKTD